MTGKRKTVDTLPVNSCVVTHVSFAGGLPQKKDVNPNTSQHQSIKYVRGVSCADHLTYVQTVTNVPIVIIIMYLYSVQYLHILQDSKRYLTNPTVQVQPQLTSN